MRIIYCLLTVILYLNYICHDIMRKISIILLAAILLCCEKPVPGFTVPIPEVSDDVPAAPTPPVNGYIVV